MNDTLRALVVEDDPKYQTEHRNILEKILGAGNVDNTDNYEDAFFMAGTNNYVIYFVDGQFYKMNAHHKKRTPEDLGDKLVQELHLAKKVDYDRIFMISSSSIILGNGQKLGVTHVYNKLYEMFLPVQVVGQKNINDLESDVKSFLFAMNGNGRSKFSL